MGASFEFVGWKNAEQGPKAAHDTRVVFRMQQLFYKYFLAGKRRLRRCQ
jgi:hypothetical protein